MKLPATMLGTLQVKRQMDIENHRRRDSRQDCQGEPDYQEDPDYQGDPDYQEKPDY